MILMINKEIVYYSKLDTDGYYVKTKPIDCEWNELPPGQYIVETYIDDIPVDSVVAEKIW